MKKSSLILIIYFMTTSYAYAYLDPGTGGAILAAIVAAFASTSVVIRNYWKNIKEFFNKKFSNTKKKH